MIEVNAPPGRPARVRLLVLPQCPARAVPISVSAIAAGILADMILAAGGSLVTGGSALLPPAAIAAGLPFPAAAGTFRDTCRSRQAARLAPSDALRYQ